MRLGKVKLDVKFEYVVDLDNKDMVRAAKDAIDQDVRELYRADEVDTLVITEETHNASVVDIPSWLMELCNEDYEENL